MIRLWLKSRDAHTLICCCCRVIKVKFGLGGL